MYETLRENSVIRKSAITGACVSRTTKTVAFPTALCITANCYKSTIVVLGPPNLDAITMEAGNLVISKSLFTINEVLNARYISNMFYNAGYKLPKF